LSKNKYLPNFSLLAEYGLSFGKGIGGKPFGGMEKSNSTSSFFEVELEQEVINNINIGIIRIKKIYW
jgi:hypothetical protein